jgi:hypothetical protein
MREAVAFGKGTTYVLVSDKLEFNTSDEVFGSCKNQMVELPTAAALVEILGLQGVSSVSPA